MSFNEKCECGCDAKKFLHYHPCKAGLPLTLRRAVENDVRETLYLDHMRRVSSVRFTDDRSSHKLSEQNETKL